ncbi:acyl-CoA/acyl-ACP dehydrogenase [Alkalicoccus halolimnae]|uniref:Acyl-CoA/acyl-ACP dehydrogenase n=1 Tax=Alkalicoccus halolimnae TaxID=1667239 RepID=A0A5C7F5F6_9BACI|nr:acyl-CoA/acyl-ACP dehydrogenase [Alkalicoccus halolimnae]TXF83915.1 acyl-CoA dehydrogenase [Alkalicoccus halolimnae]
MHALNYDVQLDTLLQKDLKPLVRSIDEKAYYPKEFLLEIGKNGFLSSEGITVAEAARQEVNVVQNVSSYCMTTGFNLWCHMAALTYVRHTENQSLKDRFLPALENGELLGATGLSNPMKYYAGLEKLHLKAERVNGGYTLKGALPAVSNLGEDHWFGAVAEVDSDKRIMAFVSCSQENLELKEKVSYLGLNGSATYACRFDHVFVPDEQILAEDADSFIQKIRPYFVTYQVPVGLGVVEASIKSVRRCAAKQGGVNELLPVQADDLQDRFDAVQQEFTELLEAGVTWKGILSVRRTAAYLTMEAVHAAMMHAGGAAYLQTSADGRRLREAYFFMNLTPTVKHLEKMLQ